MADFWELRYEFENVFNAKGRILRRVDVAHLRRLVGFFHFSMNFFHKVDIDGLKRRQVEGNILKRRLNAVDEHSLKLTY